MPNRTTRTALAAAALTVLGLAQICSAQATPGQAGAASDVPPTLGQPALIDGRLVFPQDPDAPPIPRFLTENERIYLEAHPLVAGGGDLDGGGVLRGPFASPTGMVRCPGEYEPCDGIIISWKSFTTLQAQMGALITNQGNANLYVACDSTTARNNAQSALTSAGANMSRVQYIVTPTNTVWIRDYGPRYIYEGGVRGIVDHTYNRPRPNDNVFPTAFAAFRNHPRYLLPLIHGGGNYHLNGQGAGWATRLIANENPSLTEPQIIAYWQQFQNVGTTITDPFPTTVDLTQHIDMWMQITGDSSVMIADWPSNVGSTQDMICDSTAAAMAADGWTVARVPGRSISGTHYTYTNVVMCNDIVLVPSYTHSTIVGAGHNQQAADAWAAHMPSKQIHTLNCQAIVTSAGVMHCIVMHVPAHLGAQGPFGGLAPTAYLRNFRGGEEITGGDSATVRWINDDDLAVTSVDILLSTDGGATFPIVLAAATQPDGTHTFTVPDEASTQARIRIVARDAAGNTGADESPADFTIVGAPCIADFDGDGVRSVADIFAYLAAWFTYHPSADLDGVLGVDVQDIFTFLGLWFAGCD